MAKRLISSENYALPVILAILVHVLVLGGFFIVWTTTPEVPVAKPTMIATLYEVQSKSPATKESDEKFAGESNKTKAPLAKDNQIASQKEEQKKIAEQQAKAKAAEQAKQQADALAKKQAEEEAKAVALAKKQAEDKTKADVLAKKQAEEKAKADALAKKKAEEKAKADALAKKQAEAKADAKAKAEKAARKAKEDKEAQALADLLGDKVELGKTKGDQSSDKVVGSLDDLVKRLVQDNWTELGNPSPGTSVELTIQMLPDGTITNVTVSRSSGNAAFDASAVTAAKNVGRIPEIRQLDTNTFNRLYRQRTFIFTAKGS